MHRKKKDVSRNLPRWINLFGIESDWGAVQFLYVWVKSKHLLLIFGTKQLNSWGILLLSIKAHPYLLLNAISAIHYEQGYCLGFRAISRFCGLVCFELLVERISFVCDCWSLWIPVSIKTYWCYCVTKFVSVNIMHSLQLTVGLKFLMIPVHVKTGVGKKTIIFQSLFMQCYTLWVLSMVT